MSQQRKPGERNRGSFWNKGRDEHCLKQENRKTMLVRRKLKGFPSGSAVNNLPAKQEMWVQSQGWEGPLEKGNGNLLQYSYLENLSPRGSKRVGHDWATKQQQQQWKTLWPGHLVTWWMSSCVMNRSSPPTLVSEGSQAPRGVSQSPHNQQPLLSPTCSP